MCREIEPMVSVIMPAYNAQLFIRQAVESVLAQQGDIPREVLIIDDGSTDQTKQVVQELMEQNTNPNCVLRFFENNENQGVAESRNIGIRQARGEYVAFLDADDWWSPQKLRIQLQVMEREQVVLCCTARELMKVDGSSMGRYIGVPKHITFDMLLRTNSIPCSSVMAKREAVQEFYMCHDELHEDYILWLLLLKKYGMAYGINKPFLKSRMSEGGKSRNKLRSAKMHYGVYRYLGIGKIKSLYLFLQYMIQGVRKYYSHSKQHKILQE